MEKKYNTKQKECIINYLKENTDRQFTLFQLSDILSANYNIGKSTVYRIIKKLYEEKEVKMFHSKDGKKSYYQYSGDGIRCDEHFHLKCFSCGKLVHLSCTHMDSLKEHILKNHSFELDPTHTVLYGYCDECNKRRRK